MLIITYFCDLRFGNICFLLDAQCIETEGVCMYYRTWSNNFTISKLGLFNQAQFMATVVCEPMFQSKAQTYSTDLEEEADHLVRGAPTHTTGSCWARLPLWNAV